MSPRVKALQNATPGHWVVLSQDESRIVASSPDLEATEAEALRAGIEEPVLTFIPPDWTPRALPLL